MPVAAIGGNKKPTPESWDGFSYIKKDKSSLEADTDTNRGRVVFFNKSIT